MKRILLFVLILAIHLSLTAQWLSEKSSISIFICSPGDYLYTTFGHTTIRVVDSTSKIDYIFHYGTFNFNEKNFYWKFIRGRLHYMLSVQTYKGFYEEYASEGRDVWELKLNLDYDKRKKIFKYLMWKSKPENKYYLYDFFYDNCATRVRDVFTKFLGDTLKIPQKELNVTYRQAIQPSLMSRPWIRLGINLGLGLPADKKLNTYTAMFLPNYLDTAFSQSILQIGDTTLPFEKSKFQIINSGFVLKKTPFYRPSNVFWFLLVLLSVITFYEVKRHKNYRGIDAIWLIITGIAGLIILFLWFGTDHSPTKNNLNIIWALPLNLIAVFLLLKKKMPQIVEYYFRFLFVYYILFLIFWTFSPQQFDKALLPFILILIMRSGMYFVKPLKNFKFF